jgi:hypothetical protein
MGTLPNQNSGGQQRHDGQKNYQHSNQRNPDHNRSDTRDHDYKDYEESLTNDANFKEGKPVVDDLDFSDNNENVNPDEKTNQP